MNQEIQLQTRLRFEATIANEMHEYGFYGVINSRNLQSQNHYVFMCASDKLLLYYFKYC